MNKNNQNRLLFPIFFKKVAFGIMILSVLFAVLTISEILPIDKDIAKTIFFTGILVSLLLLMWTRNKIEDELTLIIRLRAFASSFIAGIVLVIVEPFISLLFQDGFLIEITAPKLLIMMLIVYYGTFNSMLKQR